MNSRLAVGYVALLACAPAMSQVPTPSERVTPAIQINRADSGLSTPVQPQSEVLARIGPVTLTERDLAFEQLRRTRDGLPTLGVGALFDSLVRDALAASTQTPRHHDTELDVVLAEALVRHDALVAMAAQMPDDAAIERYYQQHTEDFARPERVRLNALPMPTERAAREAMRALSEGATFEELAAQSADPTTRRDQADIGWVTHDTDRTAPALVAVGFALASPGDVSSSPVPICTRITVRRRLRSVTRWYVVGLTDREPALTTPLSEAHRHIAHRLTRERYLSLRREARDRWRAQLAPAVLAAIDNHALSTVRVAGR